MAGTSIDANVGGNLKSRRPAEAGKHKPDWMHQNKPVMRSEETFQASARLSMLGIVPRRACQIVAASILVVGTLIPMLEFFDHWDHAGSQDTELKSMICIVSLRLASGIAGVVKTLTASTNAVPHLEHKRRHVAPREANRSASVEITSSPPLIPLRI